MKRYIFLLLWLIPLIGIGQTEIITYDWLTRNEATTVTPPPFAYDVDYQAVLTRATALGYTLPSDSQKLLQNNLVIGLKSAGIWSGLDVLYVYATDGSSDFATLNWKSPSNFQCTKVNSPTFTTNQGFTGNGTTSYLNTNWDASINGVNYTQNNSSFGLYVNTNVASATHRDLGAISPGVGFYINSRIFANYVDGRINAATSYTTNPNVYLSSIGFHQIQRTSNNVSATYRDGVGIISSAIISTALVNLPMYVCSLNGGGFSTRQISMAFTGASLAGLELSFYNLWNTYFTSL